jgi:general secretion pathway protein F
MLYAVRAIDQQQVLRTIQLEALDERDARSQLAGLQLTPLEVRAASRALRAKVLGRSNKDFGLLHFSQELQVLVSSGLSIVETLEAMIERAGTAHSKTVLLRLLNQLREGQRLSGALAQQPESFPPLFVGIVQAAEDTSDLPQALQRYIGYESQLQNLLQRIGSAVIYPTILMGVGGSVAAFLLGYVVPRFATVYQGAGRPIPTASQWLLAWGQLVANHQMAILMGLIALGALVFWWVRKTLRGGGWWRLLKWIPGARPKLHVLELSRVFLTLGMLLEGGIPILRAMELTRAVLPLDRQLALSRAQLEVSEGIALSTALDDNDLSTPVASRMLRVGERSGQLGTMLGRAAAFYDNETSRWIERLTKAFEPILMAAIGVVIGLIVILLYMPIFDLAGSLQ